MRTEAKKDRGNPTRNEQIDEMNTSMNATLRVLTIASIVWCGIAPNLFAQVGSAPTVPTQQQLGRLGLERVWWAQAIMNPRRDKIEHLAVDEDAVYVQVSSGVTTAFDTETGRQKWAVRLGEYDQLSFPAVSNEEEVIIVVGSTMYGLHKGSGRILWSFLVETPIVAGPSVDHDRVYFGNLEGMVFAFDLRKIRLLYNERRLPNGAWDALLWQYKAGKRITSPPIVTSRVICFASQDASLYILTAKEGKLVYQMETDKPAAAPLLRLENTVFLSSLDGSFLAINLDGGIGDKGTVIGQAPPSADDVKPEEGAAVEAVGKSLPRLRSGQIIWEFTSALAIRKPMWGIGNNLYVTPERGGVYCVDPLSGVRKWSQPNLSSFLAELEGLVATTDYDGNLVMVTKDRGQIVGSLELRRFAVRIGNDRTDRIYLSTDSGLVICMRQKGHADPVYHRFPDRLPLLPEFEPEEGQKPDENAESTETPAEEK